MAKAGGKDDLRFRFRTKDLAEIFGVTYTAVEKWNLPKMRRVKGQDQREVFYDIRKVVQVKFAKAGSGKTQDLFKEQAELARVRRQKLEIEVAELRGELIQVSVVKEEFFKIARTFRDSMLSIPNRISTVLAAEKRPHVVNHTLTDEIELGCKCLKLPSKL